MLPGPISEIVPFSLAHLRFLATVMHAGNLWIGFVWRRGVLGYAFAPSTFDGLGACLSCVMPAVVLVASRLPIIMCDCERSG